MKYKLIYAVILGLVVLGLPMVASHMFDNDDEHYQQYMFDNEIQSDEYSDNTDYYSGCTGHQLISDTDSQDFRSNFMYRLMHS
ncbi:MAG: hypothetical protein KKF44_03925 [Nanoarchaeota archaeon]|nr:hypothetical protein [Nanoarchaeota archaeon]